MYAELAVRSAFSFQEGASTPEDLVLTAAARGLKTLALTDRHSLSGVVRAHGAARRAGVRLVVGARLDPADGPPVLCLPTDRAAYGLLCQLLSHGRPVDGAALLAHAAGQILILVAAPEQADFVRRVRTAHRETFLAAIWRFDGTDRRRLAALATLAGALDTPLVATNDVLYDTPARRPVQDALTCLRHHCTLATAGRRLAANAERHLKGPEEMARLFARYPEAVTRTEQIAARCRFSLEELRYEYPVDSVPAHRSADAELAARTETGAARRYPEGVPARVRAQLDHELALIARLGYAPYFLTVDDMVRFARDRGILCQGRGSAANSAVCYSLGITAVDPARADLLFERFISEERGEPPDIDVDFENDRREEVIQHLYTTYGRHRAALAATVITYRTRGALRDAGRVAGLDEATLARLSRCAWRHGHGPLDDDRVREAGLDPDHPALRLTLTLAEGLRGLPRHLSQHVGGFVITRGPLDTVAPVLPAAMAERSIVAWDKDDLDALGILKVDVLALGMLSALRRCFDLVAAHHGRVLSLATVPAEDPATYAMLSRGDSLGVFQVESRAQMAMLPRLRPRTFYDLVIEVALVRPGPIQGDMVHPYLRRRNGEEPVTYPSPALEAVLAKTLGVPLFQEQAMRVAMVAAGFTAGEADQLRKAMAAFRRTGALHQFRDKFLAGMAANGYPPDFAERCFQQIEGFGEYGFPESHAASFALLAYVSAWLRCHYPVAYACALLNSQPMGFYAPAQIVRDLREHGGTVRPVDVNHSHWHHTLEDGGRALRLGLRLVTGLKQRDAEALVAARHPPYDTPRAVQQRAGLTTATLRRLAAADAFAGLGLDRRQALWQVRGLRDAAPLPLFAAMKSDPEGPDSPVMLPDLAVGESVVADYAWLGLSLRAHPLALVRPALPPETVPATALAHRRNGSRVTVAGLVISRQRPGSASGVVFVTLEDETAIANLVLWPAVFETHRLAVVTARLMLVTGRLQRQEGVTHVIAQTVTDRADLLAALDSDGAPLRTASRDFH